VRNELENEVKGFKAEGQTFKARETFDLDGNLKKVGDRWLIVGI